MTGHDCGASTRPSTTALSNDAVGYLEPEQTYDLNHHATVRLARPAKDAGAERFGLLVVVQRLRRLGRR